MRPDVTYRIEFEVTNRPLVSEHAARKEAQALAEHILWTLKAAQGWESNGVISVSRKKEP